MVGGIIFAIIGNFGSLAILGVQPVSPTPKNIFDYFGAVEVDYFALVSGLLLAV